LLQTTGLVTAQDHVAEEDCDAGALYRKAGAIPVTVTNVQETCMWWDNSNHVFGRTKNPYNNSRTPGGSTGGEAALLTCAGAVIGIGTDIAGSIRIPSAFCGIYGHKPSRGVVSNWGTFPYCQKTPDKKDIRPTEMFISTGPMCRYAKDLPLLMKVLSENDSRIKLDEKVDFRKVKVYYMKEMQGVFKGSRPDIKKAIIKLQIYGYNSDLYQNITEAMSLQKNQGLVGISILLQTGDLSNPELRILTSQLHKIIHRELFCFSFGSLKLRKCMYEIV
ncbi:fatty-acid amide hydrolase 2, partial [Trichonephila clavata]